MNPRTISISVTPAGFVSLLTLILLTVVGCTRLSPGLITPGVLGLLVWVTSRWLARNSLQKISIDRNLPKRAFVGESFAIESRVRNTSRFLPASGCSIRDPFAGTDKPVPSIHPNDSAHIEYPGKYGKRGPVVSREVLLSSKWPLGLFETSRNVVIESASRMTVLPSPFLPTKLQQHLDRLEQESLWSRAEFSDPASEFRLLREFRHGDSVRSIHWPSSLRCNALQVRETDPPGLQPLRNGIILHSFAPPGQLETPERYEMVLRIVMALLLRFRSRRMEVLYYSGSGDPLLLSTAGQFDSATIELATIQRSPLQNLGYLTGLEKTYRSCDQIFAISDAPRSVWEGAVQSSFPGSICIDAESISKTTRPEVRKKRKAIV